MTAIAPLARSSLVARRPRASRRRIAHVDALVLGRADGLDRRAGLATAIRAIRSASARSNGGASTSPWKRRT